MNKEREKRILEIILKNKSVSVKELSKILYSSEPSIRRDLASLEKQRLVKRVHGGAVLEENGISSTKIPFIIRELEQSDAKIIIAKQAVELVNDGDVVFIDGSSSAYNLIPYLALKKDIIVITSGVKALIKLSEYNIKTISTGGDLLSSCLSLVGDPCYNTIEQYNADIAFFSCRGLSFDGQLTDISEQENLVRRKMMEKSKKNFLLCTSEKIGEKYYHKLCMADKLDGIICDKPLPYELQFLKI